MSLLDSNIVIGAAKMGGEALFGWIDEGPHSVSAVTYIEVLGYHRLTDEDRADLEAFFSAIEILPITPEVVERAVQLRQARKMSLGDAIVAGAALVHELALVTRDTKDFARVDGLTIIDPSEEA